MSVQTNPLPNCELELSYGLVIHFSEDVFGVECASGSYPLRRAKGCLIAPRPGDLVLVSLDAGGRGYILSVLERNESSPEETELSFDGDVHFNVRHGSLLVSAGDQLALSSQTLAVEADEGDVSLSRFNFIGGIIHAQAKVVNYLGETINTICHLMTQRMETLFRNVETHEELQAGSSRHISEKAYVVQARNATIMSEKVTKLDGEQVQLG